MEVKVRSTKETKILANKLAKKVMPGDVIALYGDLGSGKTTFTRYLVESLGFASRVQSPTFIIIRKYNNSSNDKISVINHIDLYRITNESEISDLGIVELFNIENEVTIIEWPENAETLLPEATIKVYFKDLGGENRLIRIENKDI